MAKVCFREWLRVFWTKNEQGYTNKAFREWYEKLEAVNARQTLRLLKQRQSTTKLGLLASMLKDD